jgi:hypothetical protein
VGAFAGGVVGDYVVGGFDGAATRVSAKFSMYSALPVMKDADPATPEKCTAKSDHPPIVTLRVAAVVFVAGPEPQDGGGGQGRLPSDRAQQTR